MVKESGLNFPNIIEVEGGVDQGYQLFSLSHQIDQLFHDVLEVLVGSIVADHALDQPFILYLVVE